jgi:hypothetical protein
MAALGQQLEALAVDLYAVRRFVWGGGQGLSAG